MEFNILINIVFVNQFVTISTIFGRAKLFLSIELLNKFDLLKI